MRAAWSVLCLVVAVACGPSARDDSGGGDAGPCPDGERRCEGNTFEVCSGGAWMVIDQCALYCSLDGCTSCQGPGCQTDACTQPGSEQSNLGCEYWSVDLDNATDLLGSPWNVPGMECSGFPSTKLMMGTRACYDGTWQIAGGCDGPDDACPQGFSCVVPPAGVCGLDGDHAPFAIVVSNPQGVPVAVTLTIATGQSMTVPVMPGAIRALFPQQMGFPDLGIDGTGTSANAYKLTANAPIVAYQFNPLNNVDVFSNDASLLLPRTGFGKRYYAVTYPTLTRRGNGNPGRDHFNGYVTVVAWQDDTQITVTPSAATVAGRDGTPALAAGVPHAFTLRAHDVLSFEAAAGSDPWTNEGLNGGDLTGTLIESTNGKTFGVFGGHEAVRISAPGSDCCADHLEEMLFPTATWGKQFEIARTVERRGAPDILRIVASTAGTQLAFTPQPQGSCPMLGAGEHCDVRFTEATEVVSTQPVMVAHLMMSAIQGMAGTGDPSLGIVPPVEQFRTDYKFLAPMDYDNQYVDIVAMAGDTVTLDGVPVTGFATFGARMVTTVPLTVGTHAVSCPLKCSVEVYGWSQAVSYLFAGGLDLHPLVIE